MLTTVVAWSLLVSFLVLQRVMRRGQPARSLQAPPADRGSTRLLGAAFGLGLLALVAAPALNATVSPPWTLGAPPAGSGSLSCSAAWPCACGPRRCWAATTRTLRHAADQPVLASGPYRLLRH
jgi:hypothetical protein